MIKSSFFGVLFLLVFVLPFIHSEFKRYQEWKPYKEHYKKYNVIIGKANSSMKDIAKELRDAGLDYYANKIDDVSLVKKNELKEYHKIKKELKQEFSFLGYTSFRYFLYAIGMPFLALVLSLFVLYILYNPSTIRVYKNFYKVVCFGFVYVSSFWFLRSFLTRTDFPKWSYNMSYVLSALMVTLLVFILVKILTYINNVKKKRQEELEEMINSGKELVNLLKTS
ncbi:hypothetical protein [Tenacibaculum amylolyticum]|uniref:hypothetical protein n=1 Tax=Tenacibaculum amylolyticum TaxID=104269 RepID=UPI003894C468